MSEFGDDIRQPHEPPQQWLFLLHEKWWVRDRAEIKLEEPGLPERPLGGIVIGVPRPGLHRSRRLAMPASPA